MFSLVIPYHNRRELLPRTLRSVVAQRYRPLQVVLVDNGSTDGSVDVCREFVEEARGKEESEGLSFLLIEEPTPGAAAARNAGLQYCTAEWVLFFDSDDELSPEFLTDAAEAIHKHEANGESLDLIAAATRMVFADGRERVRTVFHNASVVDQILCGMLATQGMVLRRTFLVEQGGWNAALPYWNDWELGCRLLLARPHMAWLRGRAYHRIYQHADSITGTDFTSHAALALQSIDAVETTVRATLASDESQRNESQRPLLRRCLRALDARRAILAGHVLREARKNGQNTAADVASLTRRHSLLTNFLRFYVAHGGRAAWRIARFF